MPRANKVRVTNIRLDSDAKIIGDKTWDLFGNSSIFLLENGGGKTSIIQLLHQVVLPNHTIQKRVMANGVKKDSTRHIAVEWISDDEKHPNFVTGFCFHNYGVKQGTHHNRTYDYFNYLFEYDMEDGLQLKDLPFTQNGGVTTLDQLRNKLKQVPGLHLFNTNKEYQEALEQYGLLESEWKNIAKVNGEEGGVTEFFDSTSKTVTLIERLLIPSLTESLYDSKEERNAIVESFKKYKKGLLELPGLEKDLQDFEVILDHSDPIIDSFKQLETTMDDLEVAKVNLTKFYMTMSNKTEDNTKLLVKIKEALAETKEQQQILDWRIETYKIYLLERQLKIHNEIYENNKEEVKRLQLERQSIEIKIKEQKAAKAYERYREHNRKVNDINSKLDVIKMDVEKQSSEYLKAMKEVSEQYQYLLDKLLKRHEENDKTLNEITRLKVSNKNKLTGKLGEKSNIDKSIAKLEERIEQYSKEKLSLQVETEGLWEKDASTTNEKIELKLKEEDEIYRKTEDKLIESTSNLEKVREDIIRLENELPVKNNELDLAISAFDLFTKEETLLKEELGFEINFSVGDDLFDSRDMIYFNLEREQGRYSQEHTQISMALDHVLQLKNGIEQHGYHVHPEIEEVIEYLTAKRIDIISGVEWITNSLVDNDEKLALLKKNPMLSFSILAEASQMNEIKNTLKAFKKELTVPIIFLDRLELNNQEDKGNFYPLEEHLYVFNQFNIKLTLQEWEVYVQDLEEIIEDKRIEERALKQKIRRLDQTEYKMEDFYKTYHAFSRERFAKEVKKLKEEVETKLSEKEKFESYLITIEEIRDQMEQTLKQIQERIESVSRKDLLIKDFLKRYSNIESSLKEMENAENMLLVIVDEIGTLHHKDTEFERKQLNIRQVIDSLKSDERNMRRDFNDYNYELTQVKMPTDQDRYEIAKSYYNQLKSNNSVEQTHIQNFQESLNTYQEMMGEAVKVMEKNGFSVKVLERLHIVHDESLLSQLEFDYKASDDEFRDFDKELAVVKSKKGETNEGLKRATKEIEELYSEIIDVEGPFEYGPAAESEYELYQSERESLKFKHEELTRKSNKIETMNIHFNNAIDELNRQEEFFVQIKNTLPFEDEEWDSSNPMNDVYKYVNAIRKEQKEIKESQQQIKDNIWNLKSDTEKTGNNHLIHSMSQFIRIFEGSNYDEAIESFYKMLEGIDGYRQSLEARRKHSDKSRSELIEHMYQRAEVIHKNIVDIAKSSKVEDEGKVVNLINITWPKNEYNHAKYQLRTFMDDVLNELTSLKKKGALEKEIDDKFNSLASLFNIVNCYADTTKCNIKVLKPRNELLSMNKEYVTWDNIETEWSGGERQIARISMFISFLNHLRKAKFAKELSWKFLIFDNPFDKIQSDHVVKPMIELAKRTNTQLLCFTGIDARTIQQEFDTVISNQYIYQHGSLLLESEADHKQEELTLEALFYSR